ncbi:MAG: helix-turn-helix domain-containing protein [Anaerolineales bacterium]|nr:helix-turn-helix domain-containing protein [Anaerolineales bacterium]
MASPEPFMINDLETLRVLSDPLRTMILETVESEPQTVKQVAEKLGLAPSRLYYHVNLLEKHGFLTVVERRLVANMVEKIYRATSSRVEIAPDLLDFRTEAGKQAIDNMLLQTIDTTREDLLRSLQTRYRQLEEGAEQRPRSVVVNRSLARLPDERADEFCERLKELLQEFEVAGGDSPAPEQQTYALTVAFYPSFRFDRSKETR